MIDAHAHLYHPSWYPAVFNDQLVSSLGEARLKPTGSSRVLLRMLSDQTGASTIRSMDDAGIEHRIVAVLDWGLELGEPDVPIDRVHEEVLGVCRRNPDRLTGLAGLDPRRPDAASLFTWAVDSLGARGLKLHPTSRHWTLSDERTMRLVSIADERELMVLVHVGETMSVLSDHNAQPQALLSLAEQFPRATFIAGHAGFGRWAEFGADGELMPNLLLDVSGWQSRDDGSGAFIDELHAIVDRFPGQVIFGTDSPFFGLPAGGADARWLRRLEEVLGLPGSPWSDDFFAHPIVRALIERERT